MTRLKLLARAFLLTLLLSISIHVKADNITGKIVFDKIPPFAGIVYMEDLSAGVQSSEIDQKDKSFDKRIAVVSPDGALNFTNSDPFDHNIYADDLISKIKFEIGIIPSGGEEAISVDWPENTLVRVGCKIHPKMRSYIANIQSNHYQVIEFDRDQSAYEVKLLNVPENISKLSFLIPGYESVILEINKGENKAAEILKRGKSRGTITLVRE